MRPSYFPRFRVGPTFLAGASALALVLAGCSSTAVEEETTGVPAVSETEPLSDQAPAGFEEYYSQTINWRECEAEEIASEYESAPEDLENYQCATLQAPMNWEDADSRAIELAIARYVGGKEGADNPPLFYNLGGPGGGSVGSLASVVGNLFTEQVVDAFYVVALDPRGVGSSSPIWCLTDEERDADNSEDYDLEGMTSQEIVDQIDKEMAEFGNKCLERNGDIVGFVDSDSVARDFDMARAVLGAQTMDYVGYSYGTLLGALYADTFPDSTGRFVLDGALDPSLNANEVSALQIAGMEQSLYNWIESCEEEKSCPLGSNLEEGKQTMLDFFDSLAEQPLETSDPERPLTLSLAMTAVIGSLYSTDLYPVLTTAMTQALKGDGSALLFMADYFNDRDTDGTYLSNSSDAFMVINALDYEPVGTVEEWEAEGERLASENPILGADAGFASAGLSAWPVESRAVRRAVEAADAPPVLIIGTTHDPATPYVMAESLHEQMKDSVLLTVEGWDHTAYSASASACVRGAVDNFLLQGEMPAEGTVCD